MVVDLEMAKLMEGFGDEIELQAYQRMVAPLIRLNRAGWDATQSANFFGSLELVKSQFRRENEAVREINPINVILETLERAKVERTQADDQKYLDIKMAEIRSFQTKLNSDWHAMSDHQPPERHEQLLNILYGRNRFPYELDFDTANPNDSPLKTDGQIHPNHDLKLYLLRNLGFVNLDETVTQRVNALRVKNDGDSVGSDNITGEVYNTNEYGVEGRTFAQLASPHFGPGIYARVDEQDGVLGPLQLAIDHSFLKGGQDVVKTVMGKMVGLTPSPLQAV